jgi:hypothetical protein
VLTNELECRLVLEIGALALHPQVRLGEQLHCFLTAVTAFLAA